MHLPKPVVTTNHSETDHWCGWVSLTLADGTHSLAVEGPRRHWFTGEVLGAGGRLTRPDGSSFLVSWNADQIRITPDVPFPVPGRFTTSTDLVIQHLVDAVPKPWMDPDGDAPEPDDNPHWGEDDIRPWAAFLTPLPSRPGEPEWAVTAASRTDPMLVLRSVELVEDDSWPSAEPGSRQHELHVFPHDHDDEISGCRVFCAEICCDAHAVAILHEGQKPLVLGFGEHAPLATAWLTAIAEQSGMACPPASEHIVFCSDEEELRALGSKGRALRSWHGIIDGTLYRLIDHGPVTPGASLRTATVLTEGDATSLWWDESRTLHHVRALEADMWDHDDVELPLPPIALALEDLLLASANNL